MLVGKWKGTTTDQSIPARINEYEIEFTSDGKYRQDVEGNITAGSYKLDDDILQLGEEKMNITFLTHEKLMMEWRKNWGKLLFEVSKEN